MPKSSRAISRVNVEFKINVLVIGPVSIMRVDPDLQNVFFNSTSLIAREDFGTFVRRESLKTYTPTNNFANQNTDIQAA
jgi:hypothetical protein